MKKVIVKESFVDIRQLTLFVKNEHGRYSVFTVMLSKGFPRVSVKINGPDKTVKGRDNEIVAAFNYMNIYNVVELLREIINAAPGTIIGLETKRPNKEDKSVIEVESKLFVGKTAKGFNYFKIVAPGKPEIIFPLVADTRYMNVIDEEGKNITTTPEGSNRFTRIYANIMETELNRYLGRVADEEAFLQSQSGNSGYFTSFNKEEDNTGISTEDLF